jgi:hypothetical protein
MFHFGRNTCASDLITLGMSLVQHSMLLGVQTCKSDSITLGRNLIYHSILTSALKHNILVKVIRLHLAGT